MENHALIFKRLSLPTLFYGIFYTFCLYKNFHSIWMVPFVLSTLFYGFYALRITNIEKRKGNTPYIVGIVLLAISTGCTTSTPILMMNYLGILLLLIVMLIRNVYDTKKWTLSLHFCSIIASIGGSILSIEDFFSDFGDYSYEQKDNRSERKNLLFILLGILISIPIVLILVLLLASADAVFFDMIANITFIDFDLIDFVGIIFTFLFAIFASYCGIRFLGKRRIPTKAPNLKHFEPIVGNTILICISSVYLIFSLIQIIYLFIGNMSLPDEYTYASYAREGFFQLLVVCLINIALVLFFLGFFKDNLMMKILLTIICCTTYIMIASSALRMCLYIQAYNLTFLRIFVLWVLALLAVILVGIIILIFKNNYSIFRHILVTTTVFYLCFSFAHPDYWIAKYNIIVKGDTSILCELSTDAAPAIAEYSHSWAIDYENSVVVDEKINLRNYNVSTAIAKWCFRDFVE